MNIKRKDGVTLLELIIAIALSMPVMGAVSAMYLSTNNIAKETIGAAQADRNAQTVLMHMQKNICDAATGFVLEDNKDLDGDGNYNDTALNYRKYAGTADICEGPTITCRYEYIKSAKEVIFKTGVDSICEIVVGRHIEDCVFTKDGVMLGVEIAALDNNNTPSTKSRLNTWIQATATASDAVFL